MSRKNKNVCLVHAKEGKPSHCDAECEFHGIFPRHKKHQEQEFNAFFTIFDPHKLNEFFITRRILGGEKLLGFKAYTRFAQDRIRDDPLITKTKKFIDDTSSLVSHNQFHIRSHFANQFDPKMFPFIEGIIDVKGDGNCGYRAIAACLGLKMGEESWPFVRLNLVQELEERKDLYIILFGSEERYQKLKQSLFVESIEKAHVNKWMDITDMGYGIASKYNITLVSLSMHQSMTFFPLWSAPPSDSDSSLHKLHCIGFVNNSHFVQVKLTEKAPLPNIAVLWPYNCSDAALAWGNIYAERLHHYNQLFHVHENPSMHENQSRYFPTMNEIQLGYNPIMNENPFGYVPDRTENPTGGGQLL